MTEDEIRKVYALAMTYDNRKFSEANITAWWEQAERNRWTLDEAREAIHRHHTESTDFLMPAHITTLIRANRRQPERVDESRQLERAPMAEPETIREAIAKVAKKLGWESRTKDGDDERVMAVECPACQAAPKRPCVRYITRGSHRGEFRALKNFHSSRLELAKENR